MALNFGRKKADDQPAPLNENQFADLIPDSVKTDAPLVTKRSAPPPAIIGGVAFVAVAIALGAWWMKKEAQERTEEIAAVPAMRPSTSASPAASMAAPLTKPTARVAPTKVAVVKVVKPAKVAQPAATVRVVPARPGQRVTRIARVAPGRVGIKPPSVPAGVPLVAPAKKDAPARMVPVQGAPTPISPPDGLSGTAGRNGNRGGVVVTRPLPTRLSPALQKQLDALWQQGADAKHRKNYSAARRAWTRILQLRPGHPGIQSAINQLPR